MAEASDQQWSIVVPAPVVNMSTSGYLVNTRLNTKHEQIDNTSLLPDLPKSTPPVCSIFEINQSFCSWHVRCSGSQIHPTASSDVRVPFVRNEQCLDVEGQTGSVAEGQTLRSYSCEFMVQATYLQIEMQLWQFRVAHTTGGTSFRFNYEQDSFLGDKTRPDPGALPRLKMVP
eukprot:70642-Amphidinium_carterae.1